VTDRDLQDETNRLLVSLIRMQTENQTETILELNRSGIGASRIADLLGTTPGTVNVALARAKKKSKKA
jgi:DNA-directed RNA polymerase specialized sigma24 family protein